MSAVLVAESVGKSFGQRKVLNSAFLDAHPAQITAVLGRNGAGKSTLLKIAAGRLRPDHGTVAYSGERSMRPRLHRLARRGLFFLPEGPLLSSTFTVGEHVGMFMDRYGGGTDALAVHDIRGLLKRPILSLSGGERRRVESALVWIRKPRCLIADEPFRGVDPKDREALGQNIKSLAGEGCAVVVSGHEVEDLLAIAHRVVWVTSGTSRLLGSPAEARTNERFRKHYLTGQWGGAGTAR